MMLPRATIVGREAPTSRTTLSGRVRELPEGDVSLKFEDAELMDVDFRGRNLDSLAFAGRSVLQRCDFSGVTIDHMYWGSGETTLVKDCLFLGTRFPSEMMLEPVRFEQCRFDCRLEKMFSHAGEFVECSFAGTLLECTFFGRPSGAWEKRVTDRVVNEVTGNDFSKAVLRFTGFRRGVPLRAQRFPSDLLVLDDAERALTRLDSFVQSIDDESLRRHLSAMGTRLRRYVKGGQRELLLNPADLPSMSEETRLQLISEMVGTSR